MALTLLAGGSVLLAIACGDAAAPPAIGPPADVGAWDGTVEGSGPPDDASDADPGDGGLDAARDGDADAAVPMSCPPGLAPCADGCVALVSDPAHCGGCGTACAAAELCTLGSCAAECDPSLTPCGRSCVDTSNDGEH